MRDTLARSSTSLVALAPPLLVVAGVEAGWSPALSSLLLLLFTSIRFVRKLTLLRILSRRSGKYSAKTAKLSRAVPRDSLDPSSRPLAMALCLLLDPQGKHVKRSGADKVT